MGKVHTEPKYIKTYIVLDDGETYGWMEDCQLVRVTLKGEEVLHEYEDGSIKSLLFYHDPEGLYEATTIFDEEAA